MYECDYCIKQAQHGGKCYGKYDNNPCLIFEKDPRGKWVVEDRRIRIPLGYPIPKIDDEVELVLGEVDKKVKINGIKNMEWEIEGKKGIRGLIIKVIMGYWSDENGEWKDKPVLRLVK